LYNNVVVASTTNLLYAKDEPFDRALKLKT